MATQSYTAFLFIVFCILCVCSKRDYDFEIYVSSILWSGTVDEIFFRLCNKNDLCGMFTSIPAGLQSPGQAYSFTYTTNTDIGDIYRVDIVHPGSDMLCIGHIKIDGNEYDENQHKWIDLPHCIEEADGGGCDTVTVIIPDNQWSSSLTIPCEFQSILHDTYRPSPQPTKSPVPTPKPTKLPTVSPTDKPTISPTGSPTDIPSESPTDIPSKSPSRNPSESPTDSPLERASGSVSDGDVGPTNEEQTNSELADGNEMVLSAVIGGLSVLALCLCFGILVILYCWRRRKKMHDGMEEIKSFDRDRKSVDAASNVSHEQIGFEGLLSTGHGTMNGMVTASVYDEGDDVNVVMMGSQEKQQLIAADSDDDDDEESEEIMDGDLESDEDDKQIAEGLYDNSRRNMTRGISVDSVDRDENVVPE